jgi:hypothetical protein
MDNDEAIIKEAEAIINKSAEELEAHDSGESIEHFVELEAKIFESFGFDDKSFLFTMAIVATTEAEVAELEALAPEPGVQIIKPDESKGIPNRAMGVKLATVNGDVFELLGDSLEALTLAKDDDVFSIIVRSGVHISKVSEEEGVKPSEASDATDGVLSLMCTGSKIFSITRRADKPDEPMNSEIDLKEYEVGSQKLVDALLFYWYYPHILRQEQPKLFNAAIRDLTNKKGRDNDK